MVADAGRFTAAALQSDLGAPQVSRLIGELEDRLGVKLLHRNSRHVSLTSAGERYVIKCRAILDLIDEAESEAQDAISRPSGTLKISCVSSFGRSYIQPLLMEYMREYPGVKVQYLTRQEPPDMLAEGIDTSLFCAADLPSSALVARRICGVRAFFLRQPRLSRAVWHAPLPRRPESTQVRQSAQPADAPLAAQRWRIDGNGVCAKHVYRRYTRRHVGGHAGGNGDQACCRLMPPSKASSRGNSSRYCPSGVRPKSAFMR